MTDRGNHTDRDKRIQRTQYYQHTECELCEETGFCNASDSLVACRQCQRELLPAGWGF